MAVSSPVIIHYVRTSSVNERRMVGGPRVPVTKPIALLVGLECGAAIGGEVVRDRVGRFCAHFLVYDKARACAVDVEVSYHPIVKVGRRVPKLVDRV